MQKTDNSTETKPKLIAIESPFAGQVDRNITYARRCMRYVLDRGHYPYASHLLFTQEGILDDTVQEERDLGMEAGFTWEEHADETWVFTDHGISRGMAQGVVKANECARPVKYFEIGVM